MGGARGPNNLRRFPAYIAVLGAVMPNFSFRRVPSASVGFRGLPNVRLRQHDIWEGVGRKPRFLGLFFSLTSIFQ